MSGEEKKKLAKGLLTGRYKYDQLPKDIQKKLDEENSDLDLVIYEQEASWVEEIGWDVAGGDDWWLRTRDRYLQWLKENLVFDENGIIMEDEQ